nr:hypothetical protein [Mycoplasmopsis bovis]
MQIFEDFLENVPRWEILVADKGFRTKAITELLEQNKKLSTLPLKRNTTLIREKLDENLALKLKIAITRV